MPPFLDLRRLFVFSGLLLLAWNTPARGAEPAAFFRERVASIFQRRCLSCHNAELKQGGLSLETRQAALKGGESGEVIVPGNPDGSYLLSLITPAKGQAEMPKEADPLSPKDVAAIRQWIEQGAKWPADFKLEPQLADRNWWSLRPLNKPPLPDVPHRERRWARTPIDRFIASKHREKNLTPAKEADKRTLIRRLYYDLTGLPPTPEDVATFLAEEEPHAYEKLVDRLLASPQYGEHWARHWLDVVHYADTHGYDKDKPRPHAWPYRDYVIRSLNANKPYGQFVEEQIAGDILWPNTRDGIAATGFLAAGPWDFIGHVEVPESKIDGQVARHLDRDDMVTTTMNTFASLTAQCARCHDHKFDPIRTEDYYSLQAVFAAIDRADRPLPLPESIADQKASLVKQQDALTAEQQKLTAEIAHRAGPRLQALEQQRDALSKGELLPARPEFGYHSGISRKQNDPKWVQLDLGKPHNLQTILLVGCHDTFNNIGAGFGFPVRFKIEASNDPQFRENVFVIADHTQADVPNPGTVPQCFPVEGIGPMQYLRITATQLAPRKNDFIFALGEVLALDSADRNLALNGKVTSLDSIEAPVRWRRQNVVDGSFFGQRTQQDLVALARLEKEKQSILKEAGTKPLRDRLKTIEHQIEALKKEQLSLPEPQMVYAAATQFASRGQFKPTEGKPRTVKLLARGDVTKPGKVMQPGTVALIPEVPGRFVLPMDHSEGDRRRALAAWLVRRDNPLTWRSIVNRVWLYHFGRALVDSPNDFGRGGQLPSHPELLDWLAADFRDSGQSLKRLHRLICLSATYRQAATPNLENAKRDANNAFLWRMNRRRLTAEEIRDSVLAVSGQLRTDMGGPGFQDFEIEKPQHSPHYEYDKASPVDPRLHRRAIYRFIVRSQPQPMMTVLDCADPARSVPKRDETLTPLQSLSLMNNPFPLAMADQFANRLQRQFSTREQQLDQAFRLLLSRHPTSQELGDLVAFSEEFGLPATCRLLFNLNEFLFVD